MTAAHVAQLVDNAPRFAPPVPEPRFKFLAAHELGSHISAPYLVKGLIPALSLGAIVGQPGTAKSLLGLHLLTALSEERSFFGMRTRRTESLYVYLEGAAGMAKRVKAQQITGRDCSGLKFLGTSLDIRNEDDRAELIGCIKAAFAPGIVLIDTLAQSMPGADENASQDMGAGIRGLQDIQQQLGVTVIAVHHVGKDASKGPRGHSSLFGALDFAIEVRRDGDGREWQLTKAKDEEDGQLHPFTLRVVELGEDEDGDLITSAVVHEFTDEPPPPKRAKPPSGGNQRLAWLAVNDLLSASQQFGLGPAPATRKCITLEAAIDAAGMRFAVDPKRRRERAITAITGLAGRGCIVLKEEVVWLP